MSGMSGMPPPLKKQEPFDFVEIDENVAASLPSGTTIISASPHGSSFWTRTARIDVELADGTPHVYFMKVALGDVGLGMVRGEFEGVSKLYEVIPEGVPRAVAWGTYKSQPDNHFYLCDFLDMIEDLPDIHAFCSLLAKLHKESIPRSPNGKFGFHEVTYEGPMYQDTTWCDTWEESFRLRVRASLDQERIVHGSHKENEELLPALYDKVIPRLLRPLETKGRSIKPVLIHGDIWYGNMSTNAEAGEPLMFDPSVSWGHNECDLTAMGISRYRMGKHWRREYHKHFPISAPEVDYEDRMALYELRSHLCASTLYPDTPVFHEMLFNEIRRLVEKFPDGYQGE